MNNEFERLRSRLEDAQNDLADLMESFDHTKANIESLEVYINELHNQIEELTYSRRSGAV